MPKNKKPDYLNEVENIVQKGRENIQTRNENRTMLIETIKQSFSNLNMGIKTIEIDNEKINLKEPNKKLSSQAKEEAYFTELLNTGKSLYVLTVHNDFTGYTGKEKVLCENQKLSTLIDEELVKQLAPNCKIYTPQDKKPWSNIIERNSFEVYVTDYQELVNLWENLKSWVKLDWHDNITSKQKHFHKAEDVFLIELFHSFAPDLSWRYAQVKNAEKREEQVEELGDWDALAQQELKKTINSLLCIEEHPMFGKEISQMIKDLKPLLAKSMEGKKVLELASKEKHKAEKHLYNGMKVEQIKWHQWTKELPIKNVVSNKKSKKNK